MGQSYLTARRQLTAKLALCGVADAWVESVEYDEKAGVAEVHVTMGHGMGTPYGRLPPRAKLLGFSAVPSVHFELQMSGGHVHHVQPRFVVHPEAVRCMIPILNRLTLPEIREMEHPSVEMPSLLGAVRG